MHSAQAAPCLRQRGAWARLRRLDEEPGRDMKQASVDQRAYRLSAVDMLRGLAVVIMALDHVRDFFMHGGAADPMQDPNAAVSLFFTRWITHFCAPVFVFLAGASAGLMLSRKSPVELGGFLFKRGLWLILIELTIVSFGWFFDLQFRTIGFLTIWSLGISMIVL